MSEPDPLLLLAERYAAHVQRSLAVVARRAGSHERLFTRMRAGAGCNTRTYGQVWAWFDRNWPEDLEWPAGLPRTARAARAA